MNRFFNIVFCYLFPLYASGVNNPEVKIDEIVQKYHKTYSFHGNIIVKQGDRIIYQKSLGLAHDSFNVPHTMQSRFMIASVSKQFTAALILVLAQEGLIDIHQPYSHYVNFSKEKMKSENLEKWDQFTIYQLLTHTAGLYRDVQKTDFYDPAMYVPNIIIILAQQWKNYDIFFFSGEEPEYSNFGYMLLAYLAEEVSGKSYEDLLQEKIFDPLGMKSSGEYHRIKSIPFIAEGYHYPDNDEDIAVDELLRRCCKDATSFKGSSSLYSNAKDLMIWLDNLNSTNPKVLTEESIAIMTRVHTHSKLMSYGLGFYVDQFNGSLRYWHDGFEYGYLSLVSVTPKKGLKIVILGNRHDDSANIVNDFYTERMNDEISQLF